MLPDHKSESPRDGLRMAIINRRNSHTSTPEYVQSQK